MNNSAAAIHMGGASQELNYLMGTEGSKFGYDPNFNYRVEITSLAQ